MSDGFFVADLPLEVAPGDTVEVVGPEAHHMAVVRRIAVGEQVTVTDGHGRGVVGPVVSADKNQVVVEVEGVVVSPLVRPYITVVQALPKTDRGQLAVDLMTEVGVDRIVPWAASRSQVSWKAEQGAKALAKWRAAAREAAKQARRLRIPDVTDVVATADIVEFIRSASVALLMHEKESALVSSADLDGVGDVVIVIGPEGGLTDEEVDICVEAGAVTYSMGATVLRTSTAGAIAVTQVRLLADLQDGRSR